MSEKSNLEAHAGSCIMVSNSVMPGEVPLTFGVLGALEVYRGVTPIPIPAAKHRLLLGVLLANANRVVSNDSLVDGLWFENPPPTARKTVQGYIWRIRRALQLPADQLVTTASGYRLAVSAHTVDALVFERLMNSGRAALSSGRRQRGAELLAQSLRLWRGSAFEGLPASSALEAHAARLDEARLNAYEDLVAVQLDLGRYSEVIPDLTGMVSKHPWRESMCRLLMTALHRTGRPLDALDVFARFQRTVAAEYGVEPHPATTALHERILQGSLV